MPLDQHHLAQWADREIFQRGFLRVKSENPIYWTLAWIDFAQRSCSFLWNSAIIFSVIGRTYAKNDSLDISTSFKHYKSSFLSNQFSKKHLFPLKLPSVLGIVPSLALFSHCKREVFKELHFVNEENSQHPETLSDLPSLKQGIK